MYCQYVYVSVLSIFRQYRNIWSRANIYINQSKFVKSNDNFEFKAIQAHADIHFCICHGLKVLKTRFFWRREMTSRKLADVKLVARFFWWEHEEVVRAKTEISAQSECTGLCPGYFNSTLVWVTPFRAWVWWEILQPWHRGNICLPGLKILDFLE